MTMPTLCGVSKMIAERRNIGIMTTENQRNIMTMIKAARTERTAVAKMVMAKAARTERTAVAMMAMAKAARTERTAVAKMTMAKAARTERTAVAKMTVARAARTAVGEDAGGKDSCSVGSWLLEKEEEES